MKKRLAIFASGDGTNMQAIIDAINNGQINGQIVLLISSKNDAGAITRAINNGIPYEVFPLKDYKGDAIARDLDILKVLNKYNIDYIILAGYLGILNPCIIAKYKYKIVNIHPSLLPKFGGTGMYGIKVHKAVIDSKELISGATVHFVDEGTDTGPIILQKKLEVFDDDDEYSLQQRILENIEHKIFPYAISLLCDGLLEVIDGKVKILEKEI